MNPPPYARTPGEQVAALDARLEALARSQDTLATMLRQHMEREEITTRAISDRLAAIERNVSKWYGMALGVGMAVSAVWAAILAGLSFFKRG